MTGHMCQDMEQDLSRPMSSPVAPYSSGGSQGYIFTIIFIIHYGPVSTFDTGILKLSGSMTAQSTASIKRIKA